MKTRQQKYLEISTLVLFFSLLSNSFYGQSCSYSLDLKDYMSFSTGNLANTGYYHSSAYNWRVSGEEEGPAICYLEPIFDFSGCKKSRGISVRFSTQVTGTLSENDYVSVQVYTDIVPEWKDILFLDAFGLRSTGKAATYHQVFITEEMYADLDDFRLRLLVQSIDGNAAILFHDGDLHIETVKALPELTSLSSQMDTNGASLAVYPSATKDDFVVDTNIEHAKLEVFNQNGQLLYEVNLPAQKTKITTHQLKVGTYFLRVSNQNQIATGKVIKLAG